MWVSSNREDEIMQQATSSKMNTSPMATVKQHTGIDAKRKRLLMSLWLSSGKATTQSFHEWNKQRVNTLVMSWFKK